MTPDDLSKRKVQGFNWACYDTENGQDWPTPKDELADPTAQIIAAAKAAHAAGLKFIVEPGFELITGRGTRRVNGKLELTEKQVSQVRLKEVAPHLDAVSLQLQRAQDDPVFYRDLAKRYFEEVHAANPKAIVFVQITSREKKKGQKLSPTELMTSIRAVADLVDGIWIHFDQGEDNYATELLALLEKEGYR
jgi:hypothetical protein